MTATKWWMEGLVLTLMVGVSSCAVFAEQAPFLEGRKVGQIQSPRLTEISGLAASRRTPGVLWVHNDSGERPCVYAVNLKGDLLAVYRVTGAQARDWEDIAIGPGPQPGMDYLYIGDTGDNTGRYPSITVYRVQEPAVDPNARGHEAKTESAEALRMVYPDGPRDAETVLVDSLTRDIYVISKRDFFSRVYRAAYPQSTSQRITLKLVCLLPVGLATGGDVSPDGKRVIVRSMYWASLWGRDPAKPLWHAFQGKSLTLPLSSEPQGEAIGFDPNGQGYYTISEGKDPPIYYFPPAQPKVGLKISIQDPPRQGQVPKIGWSATGDG